MYLLRDALEQLEFVTGSNDLIVFGDFSVNMLKEDKLDGPKRQLLSLISSFNWKNTVESATRTTDRSQFCKKNSPTHQGTCIEECAQFSDHDLVVEQFRTAVDRRRAYVYSGGNTEFDKVSMETF